MTASNSYPTKADAGRVDLRKERKDGFSSMATNNRHSHLLRRKALGLSNECPGTHNIECCHTKDAACIIYPSLLVHLEDRIQYVKKIMRRQLHNRLQEQEAVIWCYCHF